LLLVLVEKHRALAERQEIEEEREAILFRADLNPFRAKRARVNRTAELSLKIFKRAFVTQKFFRVSSRDSRKILKFVSKTHHFCARARRDWSERE
jgi:hypothetical protein